MMTSIVSEDKFIFPERCLCKIVEKRRNEALNPVRDGDKEAQATFPRREQEFYGPASYPLHATRGGFLFLQSRIHLCNEAGWRIEVFWRERRSIQLHKY